MQEQLPSVTSMDGGNVVKMPGAFTPYSRMGVNAGLSGARLLPLERLARMPGWKLPHGWVTPSRLLHEPILHDTRWIRSLMRE